MRPEALARLTSTDFKSSVEAKVAVSSGAAGCSLSAPAGGVIGSTGTRACKELDAGQLKLWKELSAVDNA